VDPDPGGPKTCGSGGSGSGFGSGTLHRVTVQIFADRANFEGLEKTKKRMLPIIGKI
jgi:hypothetical protein